VGRPIQEMLSNTLLRASRRPLSGLPRRAPWKHAAAFKSTLPDSVAGFLEWRPAEGVPGVNVNGYVRSVRAQKRHHFVSLGDGTSAESLQAVVPADQAEGWDK
jgi:asparaginyl-tRNA synthetase